MGQSDYERRLGIALWPGTPAKETLRVGSAADKAGLDSLWITESTLAPGRDAISMLGSLSAVTSRIKLATGIINVFTRTPTLIASTIATLDELSEGRAILGLGTGHQDPLTKWHSIKFEQPLTRMREYVEMVRLVLGGGTVQYQGSMVDIRGFKLAFQPKRIVPVYIAAVGPRMARLAGELAEGVLVTLNTLPQLKRLVTIAIEAARDRGRKLDTAAYLLSFVSDDRDANLNAARRVLAMYCSAVFYRKLFASAGYETEAAEIAGLWAANDRETAYSVISERMIRDFAAVGTDECLRMAEAFRGADVTLPIISLVPVDGFETSASKLFSEIEH